MNTKIIALQSQLDLIDEANRVCYSTLINMLEEYIVELITCPNDAILLSKDISYRYNNEFVIRFEIGFEDKESPSGVDFGSNTYFDYDTRKHALSINYGTIGPFTKEEVCQIKRINLLTYVFKNIDKIEEELENICNCYAAVEYAKNYQEHIHVTIALSDAESELKQQQIRELEASIKEEQSVEYNTEKVRYSRDMVFNSRACSWKIHRITDKRVKVRSEYGDIKQFDKETFLNLVYEGKLLVKES